LFIVYVTLPPGISPIAVGINNNKKKKCAASFDTQVAENYVAGVRERTNKPGDRRLSAKLVPTFVDTRVPRGQRKGSLRPYSWLSRPQPHFLIQVARHL
jgi:hypothetical protein